MSVLALAPLLLLALAGRARGGPAAAEVCPRLFERAFDGFAPAGNVSAGVFTPVAGVAERKACVVGCCVAPGCHVAFTADAQCYHVRCRSSELCLPASLGNGNRDRVSMVLVRPVEDGESWAQLLEESGRDMYPPLYSQNEQLENDYKKFLQMEETGYPYGDSCEVGIPTSCPLNEECIQNNDRGRGGTCKCKPSHFRNPDGECVPSADRPSSKDAASGNGTAKGRLAIRAESRTVRLPQSDVSLTAVVTDPQPDADADDDGKPVRYRYEWTALTQPEGSGAVKHQNGDSTLELSKLSEGLYTFKVAASNETMYGETFVNVTVLPPLRINKPPQIVITPANQTIKLPNTGAVLDASSSTDDDGIVSYHWELQQGPLGYQPQLHDTQTLELNDLSMPGNYTFKLTVTDTNKATSVSTANITVLKITDYPPEANAGQDTIIYLPRNQITLNGNLSIDDHMITTWEWTKSPDDAEKAVDMQDTRTPYLRLSDLEEGMYTFALKVTDSANQSSVAQVHVFVKPPTNRPPVASAGANLTTSLPQTWVVVDASNSTDDNKIEAYRWEQVDGPSTVTFLNPNDTKTNVTGLTKGLYIFKVTVTDDNSNTASDQVYVTVDQNKNQKPIANGGGDLSVELPRNVIYVNGSKSSDDWAIVKWKWTRQEDSLASGNIAEGSDERPILILTDLKPGRYVFNLTVFDEQGLSDSTTVTIKVSDDPKLYFLVEMVIDTDVGDLIEAQYNTLKGKLALLIQDNAKLQVRSLRTSDATRRPTLTFYVEDADGAPIAANAVVAHLRAKLRRDADLLGHGVAALRTAVCQNACSGHGACDEATRRCRCEAFWMEDLFARRGRYFAGAGASGEAGDWRHDDSNCAWSVLYVALAAGVGALALAAGAWGAARVCGGRCGRGGAKPNSYKLIRDAEDVVPYSGRKADLSDSDTDSDVVFESRNKPSRFGAESRSMHKSVRNGFSKIGRRVKT